jgi:hypothetical protein
MFNKNIENPNKTPRVVRHHHQPQYGTRLQQFDWPWTSKCIIYNNVYTLYTQLLGDRANIVQFLVWIQYYDQ